MKNEPAINRALLLQTVRRAYGLPVSDLLFVPVGAPSLCYALRCEGQTPYYFLKLAPAAAPVARTDGAEWPPAHRTDQTRHAVNHHIRHGVFMPAAGTAVVVQTTVAQPEHLPLDLIQGRVQGIAHQPADLLVVSSAPAHRTGCRTGDATAATTTAPCHSADRPTGHVPGSPASAPDSGGGVAFPVQR